MNNSRLMLLVFAATILIFAGCQNNSPDVVNNNTPEANEEQDAFLKSHRLHPIAVAQLFSARAATQRYTNIQNAMDDGYIDIKVVVPGMGHHYLKPALADARFQPHRPELLVYEQHPYGKMKLVAVEYGVPLALKATAPEGFAGNDDVWSENHEAGMWTLHAWIYKYNPDGVFASYNPRVP